MLPSRESTAVAATTFVVAVPAVLPHHESPRLFGRFVARNRVPPRPRILVPLFGLPAARAAKIGLFARGARLSRDVPGVGELTGQDRPVRLPDLIHFSTTACTTLGYGGDVVPLGNQRFLCATAPTGLVLVTRSASLGFLAMHWHWREDHAVQHGDAVADRAHPRPEEGGGG